MPATVCAHVYEDGFVERSLTITIRDGVGYGEYQIGLNAKTADQILALAQQLKEKSVQQEMVKGKPAFDQHDHPKTQPPVSPMKAVDAGEAGDSNPAADLNTKTAPAAPKPVVLPRDKSAVGSGEHLTDFTTIKRFGALQQQWFADQLKLSCDGQPVELSKVSVEPAARHPYSVLVKFQFSLDQKKKKGVEGEPVIEQPSVQPNPDPPPSDVVPDSDVVPAKQAVDLQVTDHLFAGYSGAVRYALRARGSTMLLRSNVAPVLVRAERVEIDQKTPTGNEDSPTIQAKLTVGSQ